MHAETALIVTSVFSFKYIGSIFILIVIREIR